MQPCSFQQETTLYKWRERMYIYSRNSINEKERTCYHTAKDILQIKNNHTPCLKLLSHPGQGEKEIFFSPQINL